jgi:lysyl-tRNA synthetase class 2
MSWQTMMTWEIAQKKASILSDIRTFFAERNVVEVETPLLSHGTVTDVYLDALSCRYDFLANGSKDLYLQTSPEFAMKRLLASGYGCIYQICKAFRHEGHGRYHNPEFTIIEWYRLGFDIFSLMVEVDTLLMTILKCSSADKLTYQHAFLEFVNLDPLTTNKQECLDLILQHNCHSVWLDSADVDTLLQFIFSEIIEHKIGRQRPCFIYNFPASQASLAKLDNNDPRIASRFECYYQGIELLNGFDELSDSQQLLLRFELDNKRRVLAGLPLKEVDQRFIDALEKGLPICSGVALGLDRLIMLALSANHIDQTLTFNINNA